MGKSLLLLIAVLMAAAAPAETIFLECEAFDDLGGWTNDSQFMDQMGSPYLLAHGLGKSVADAKAAFAVRQTGTYDVWVRTKNWTAPWSKEPAGKFQVGVSSDASVHCPLSAVLGCGIADWHWEKAGAVKLVAGMSYTVALHDLTGFDGRCDAVVFTTEKTGGAGLEALRTRRKDSKRTTTSGRAATSVDLCVVGGGIGGICTAISAARLGLKVALVHDRPVLGGNNSSEVRVHLGAWQNMPPYPRLGDTIAEFGPRSGGNAMPAANYEDDRKLAAVRAEKNIDLFLNCHVNGVETNAAGAIVSVLGQDTRFGDRRAFRARWFADCTGDGTVGFLAGADWRMGREARSETGEPWAPEKADTMTMGASVQWRAEKNGNGKVAFPLKDWMIRFDDSNGRAEMRGDWDWEAGLGRDQIAEGEYIRDYGLLVAYSNWAYAKNVASNRADFADKELVWVASVAGRRESRRLMGDFILDENHILNRDVQPDGTCVTTWTIDLHFPKSAAKTKFSGEPFRSDSRNETIWPYPVPYRCFYSRNIPNLFMAGRNISVTHVALGTTRLMRTIGMMGEVVGMAASVCKRHGCNPRDVYAKHLDELKALMEKGVGDGKEHPSQMYNQQGSLDPRFRDLKTGNFQILEK